MPMTEPPTRQDLLAYLAGSHGLSFEETLRIFKVPEHPRELRDEFAMAAMQGMLSNTDRDDEDLHRRGLLAPLVAQNAYLFADAMLAQRVKP